MSTSVRLYLGESEILTMLNGDSDSPVYATDPNIKPAKQTWLLHHQDDGTVLLQNKLFGKYIGIATDLKPNVTLVATNSAIKFVMEHIKDDSYKIYAQHGDERLYLYLHPNWNISPKVALVREEDAERDWHREPAV